MTIISNGINGNKFTLVDKRVRFGDIPPDLSFASLDARMGLLHGTDGRLSLYIREEFRGDALGRWSGRMKIKLHNRNKGKNSNDFRAVKYVTDDFGNLVLAEILPQNHE